MTPATPKSPETGHTPGPWAYTRSPWGKVGFLVGRGPLREWPYFGADAEPGEMFVGFQGDKSPGDLVVRVGSKGYSAATHEANARLIAAAPDLLAACEAFVACRKCVGWDEGECDLFLGVALDKARAALALAKGQA